MAAAAAPAGAWLSPAPSLGPRDPMLRNWAEFQLLEELGRGSFGVVHRLRRKRRGELFAVKLAKSADDFMPHERSCTSTEEEVRAELTNLQDLWNAWMTYYEWDRPEKCPIVKVRGIFLSPLGLLLELHQQGLDAALQVQPPDANAMTDARRITVLRDVASACAYMHYKGMAHRDLKCSNVLVNPGDDFHACVTDFGTSHLLSYSAEDVAARGTQYIKAPELLLLVPTDRLDFLKTDVYAFGVLLRELWGGGRPPFQALDDEDDNDLVRAVCHRGWRPAVPRAMPADYAELMQACWQADPAARPSFTDVGDRLAQLYEAEKVQLARQGSLSAPAPPAWRASTSASSPQMRALLLVRYQPAVPRGAKLLLRVQLLADAASLALPPADGEFDADGHYCVQFACLRGAGETFELSLQPSHRGEEWLGRVSAMLVPGAAPTELWLAPNWADMREELPKRGLCTALKVRFQRRPAAAPGRRAAVDPPEVSLGALSLYLDPVPTPFAHAHWPLPAAVAQLRKRCLRLHPMLRPLKTDLMISYRDTETGRGVGTKKSGFAFDLQDALEAAGFGVFCYASSVSEKCAWKNVLLHGIQSCQAFIPVCSPTYGDIDVSPWTHTEVVQAERQRRTTGAPLILPVWHSGAYPPPDLAYELAGVEPVPAGAQAAESMPMAQVVAAVLQQLEAMGIRPREDAARAAG